MPTRWTPKDVAEIVGGELVGGISEDAKIASFEIRPISLTKGSFYTPYDWPPELVDMERMAWRIGPKQAAGCFYSADRKRSDQLKCILVDSPKEALETLAQHSRAEFGGTMIGITGTAGKSTTKVFLGYVLNQVNPSWITRSNQNLTPHILANLCEIDAQYEYAVMEIGLHRIDTVEKSSAFVLPDISIITSIGVHHADGLENPLEAILDAKTEILRYTSSKGTAILPSFSEHYDALYERAQAKGTQGRILSCGFRDEDEAQILDLDLKPDFSIVNMRLGEEHVEFKVPYAGEHIAQDAALVAAAIYAMGLPLDVMRAIENAPAAHSMTRAYEVSKNADVRYKVYDNSFNTGILSVRSFLEFTKLQKGNKRYIVISDIGDLGDNAEEVHDALIPDIDAAKFDFVFVVGSVLSHAARNLKTPYAVFDAPMEAFLACEDRVETGDIVFVKGTRAKKFHELVGQVKKEERLTEISS